MPDILAASTAFPRVALVALCYLVGLYLFEVLLSTLLRVEMFSESLNVVTLFYLYTAYPRIITT